MTDSQLTDAAITLGMIIVSIVYIAGAISTTYTRHVYRKRERKSVLFAMLVRDDTIKIIAATWIAFLVVLRLTNYGSAVLPAWSVFISAVAVSVLIWPTIDHAWTIYRLRHGHGGAPPEWAEDD